MIVGVDLDSVVIDLCAGWLDRYNRDFNDDLTPDKITRWATHEFVKPECGLAIYDYLNDPTLYDDCPPIKGALDGIKELREMGYRVVFPSAGFHKGKLDWLRRYGVLETGYLAENDYIVIRDKKLLAPSLDLVIDDRGDTVVDWPGHAILFDQPWNREYDFPNRAYGWFDVLSVAYKVKSLIQHPTEASYPEQAKAFREILEEMYQTHLDKNADYSPANINGCGELGLMTRVWDKTARLMNLMGYKIDVKFLGYEPPKEPKNESINDTLEDMGVYTINWRIYRQGKWGR